MSKNFDYNTDFEYWTTDGISQVQPAFMMMTLPSIYKQLMIWISMFSLLEDCNWMFIGLIRDTTTPYDLKACLDLAITDKLGFEEW